MPFNQKEIQSTEFFIQKNENDFYQITTDRGVQDELQEMLNRTLLSIGENPKKYDPSEKYNSEDRLKTDLDGEYSQDILAIYNNEDISTNNTQIITNSEDIHFYYCRLTDTGGKKLLAIKKASYFKSLTTNHSFFINWLDDKLTEFTGNIFKLDKDFDILVYDNEVLINKYLAFESIAQLAEIVKSASVANIKKIEKIAPVLAFSADAKEYIGTHISAARLVSSIRSNDRLVNLDISYIQVECQKQGIDIKIIDGAINITSENTMIFLKLIDRRLYTINLTGKDENFEAKSREARKNA